MRSLGIRVVCMALLVGLGLQPWCEARDKWSLVFSCHPDNDLYALLCESGDRWVRFDLPEEAVRYAPEGCGVLLLADSYPNDVLPITEALIDAAMVKGIRLYVEYPSSIAGMRVDAPRTLDGGRAFVTSGWFEPELPRDTILSMPGGHFVPLDAVGAHLSYGKLAGFEKSAAEYPQLVSPFAPEGWTYPLLVKHPLGNVMVGTTKLSNCITGRFAPMESWRLALQHLLRWLSGEKDFEILDWTPNVRPAYARADQLPKLVEFETARRGIQWYVKARMLLHPAWADRMREGAANENGLAPMPSRDWEIGDGKLGILEGFASVMDSEGRQPVIYQFRADSIAEVSMALALGSKVFEQDDHRTASANLQDFVYFVSSLTKGPRANPTSSSYGLLGRDCDEGADLYSGEANGRAILATLATAALLGEERWNEPLARCLLSNLRITGTQGLRASDLSEEALAEKGWPHFGQQNEAPLTPSDQAYLWASFLWADAHTGYEGFREKAVKGIRALMEAYPEGWHWSVSMQRERAQMLLPLAWLVRVDDTEEHRGWLRRIADDLLAAQVKCGGIRETLGPAGQGLNGPPASHEAYGTSEAPLIQEEGDPVCDLSYTISAALAGLHEAAAATGDVFYSAAESALVEFVCRVQARSDRLPEMDGAWYRAFDYKRWEYWGSEAAGVHGPWAVDCGAAQGWIASVLCLRHLDTSLWNLCASVDLSQNISKIAPAMSTPPPEREDLNRVDHLGVAKALTVLKGKVLQSAKAEVHPLVDGVVAKQDPTDSAWVKVEGREIQARVDLGEAREVTQVSLRFMEDAASSILVPTTTTVSFSLDGEAFEEVPTDETPPPADGNGPRIKTVRSTGPARMARYIQIGASREEPALPSEETPPADEKDSDAKSKVWLFFDEIVIR